MTNTEKKTKEMDPSPRRLLRSPDERVLTGVAGGIGKYLGVDPTFVRLAFVATVFFGGLGLLAYLVMAIVVPKDDGAGQPLGDETAGQRAGKVALYGLVAVLGLGIAFTLAALGAFATATGNGVIVAGTVIALGVALAATAFLDGGIAKRIAPWLLAATLVLAVPAGAVAAADVRFEGGIGERSYSPASTAEIPEDGYELGIGQLTVDLREIEFAPGESVELPAELGLGQMIVAVPSDVCVTGHAEAKGGELRVRGESNSGTSVDFDRGATPGSKVPQVDLDAELQFGQLVVTDRDPDEFSNRGPGDHSGQLDESAPEPERCAG